MRAISDRIAKALKAATRRSIDMAGGPEAFQHVTRVRQGSLSKYGLPGEEHEASFIPIDIALEADLEAGSPIITAELARLLGYRLVPAEAEPRAPGLTHRDVSRLSLEFDDVRRAAAEALEDDHVDHGERRAIRRQVDELKRALAEFEGKLGEGA
ncbi:MAG: hypothetical protein QMD99_03995 [Rhizobiaceae bacterium]|nr:hypothetical protein [Rhizobiaceae bacterium]